MKINRRDEIIKTAKLLFKRQDINKTSMSQIAKKAGIAKGLLYYYFKSKEDLVNIVVQEFVGDIEKELNSLLEDDGLDFYEKLSSLIQIYFYGFDNNPTLLNYSYERPEIFNLISNELSNLAFSYASRLMDLALEEEIINIEYPDYMLRVLIFGLGELYLEGLVDPNVYITLIEQILGLEKNKIKFK